MVDLSKSLKIEQILRGDLEEFDGMRDVIQRKPYETILKALTEKVERNEMDISRILWFEIEYEKYKTKSLNQIDDKVVDAMISDLEMLFKTEK